MVVKQLVAVVAELPAGPNCTVKVDLGRFHESVVVKQLVAVVAAVIVGTADKSFGDPF